MNLNSFIFIVLLLLCLHFETNKVTSTTVLTRNVRSLSGLFGNREGPKIGGILPLGIKPVTFDDVLSLREQISNLTKFSDFFRKAIEQGKKTQQLLQSHFEKAKLKVQQLQTSVNPDAENFWASSSTCGGILIGQTGKITYKQDEYCDNNERCIWTVRVNQRSKVKLRLIKSDFKGNYGFLTVTEISLDADYQRSVTKRLTGKSDVNLFDGPLIIVTFFTESIGSGFGFSLEFEGIGSNIDPPILFKHFHLTDKNGTITYPDQSNQTQNSSGEKLEKEITTFVINPKLANVSLLKVTVEKVTVNKENCENSSINLYNDLLNEYSYPERCCAKNCETDLIALDGIYFIDIVKPSSVDKLEFSWTLDENFEPVVSRDTCGGLLNITSVGIIDYKHDTYYKNNERCVWRVHSAYKNQIKLQQTREGFEKGYDYITLTEMDFYSADPPNSIIFPTEKSTILLTGSDIIITFYSDDSQFGSGFILKMEAVGSRRSSAEIKDNHYHITEGEHFSVHINEDANSEISALRSTFILNPTYPEGNSVIAVTMLSGMQSELLDQDDFQISFYKSNAAIYELVSRYNGSNIQGNLTENGLRIESMDGIMIIRYESSNNIGIGTDLKLQWEKGTQPGSLEIGDGDKFLEPDDGICGGVLIGEAGRIAYKLNETYEALERCTWTIRSAKRSKITVKLVKDDFEYCCDYLIVRELNVETGTLKNTTKIIRRGENIGSFGPIIFVTFVSDKSEFGKGFAFTFETSGQEFLSNEISMNHRLLTDEKGQYSYPEESQATLEPFTSRISTVVLSPGLINEDSKVHLIFDEIKAEGANSCEKNTFVIYSYDLYNSEEIVKCGNGEREKAIGEQLKAIDGWFLIIFKSFSPESTSFKFHWSRE